MTTEASPDPVLQTCDYILSRLTTYFGSRPDHFSTFIDGKVKAHGWFPAEAYDALSSPVLAALKTHLDRIKEDDDVRVVVVKSNGPAVSSGHDLN